MLFHGRFPSEKAAALFADKSAQAFAALDYNVTLLVPRRSGTGAKLERPYTLCYLPTIDLYGVPVVGEIAHRLSYFIFTLGVVWWLVRNAKKSSIIYSNEALPLLAASFLFPRTLYEMHDFPEQNVWMYTWLFRRAEFVLTTNTWKVTQLKERFKVPTKKIILERNAVDVDAFTSANSNEARRALSLPLDAKIVLYTGHLYSWKGVDVLAQAARELTSVEVYVVGGTPYDIGVFSAAHGDIKNLHIMGYRPHQDMPLWQAAADVLVLPNTAKETISMQYTSPMKLFEYMASERPIVASNIPSITDIISEKDAYLVEPDSAHALVGGIRQALTHAPEAHARALHARSKVLEHSWEKRARRIVNHF
jgi:glycosyltransferase involved in cell wall biosynthesis